MDEFPADVAHRWHNFILRSIRDRRFAESIHCGKRLTHLFFDAFPNCFHIFSFGGSVSPLAANKRLVKVSLSFQMSKTRL
jgi:hypothetical protein